ncbi:MAG: cytochrome c oxidase assembly protein [Pseudomonadota bacterium]
MSHSLAEHQRRNAITALVVLSVVFGMIGVSYAAVPLYRIFCQVTGFDGTTMRAEKPSDMVLNQTIQIRFDANVSKNLNWKFQPVEYTTTVKLGENKLAFYEAQNLADAPLAGEARFKVLPEIVGQYFHKVECFCFTEQLLAPNQSVDMPVSFFIDPEILNDEDAKHIQEITLSYSFFPVKKSKQKRLNTSQNRKAVGQNNQS